MKEATQKTTTAKAETATTPEKAEKKIKLNAEKYAQYQFEASARAKAEEGEISKDDPGEKTKKVSSSYYHTKQLAFDLTGSSYRTPQFNQDLIVQTLNKKLPSDRKIVHTAFVVRGQENLRFYPANLEAGDFIAVNAHQPIDPKKFLAEFGLKA